METIYKELLRRVEGGEQFSVDFKNKNLKISGKYLIKNGEYEKERELINYSFPVNNILNSIEYLYTNYKYSIPSERSDNKRKNYFYAYSMEEIPDERFFTSFESREVSRAKLEGFILCSILNGHLFWTSNMGNWFWQSKIDPDLILLKEWIE